ncbi:MAG: hypothetical protein ACU0BF_11620 [Paracoccaceae bacterium]
MAQRSPGALYVYIGGAILILAAVAFFFYPREPDGEAGEPDGVAPATELTDG